MHPLDDLGSDELVGFLVNYSKFISTASALKSILSRLIKTGLLARSSVAAEQLYG